MSVKKGRWLASFIFMLGVACLGGFFWWQWATGPVSGQESVVFVIKKGESLGSIAQRLKKEDLIRSPFAFRLWVLANDLTRKIQAGDFRLSQEMNLGKVAAQLTHGTLDIWVTLLEGWRSEEMARGLVKNGFAVDMASADYPEGYLFPDTYLIPKGASQEKILEMLQNNFDKKVSDSLKNQITRRGLTLKQAVILASIVEREVRTTNDRPIVAGILVKRWQNDWPLQADATVQYAKANQTLAMIEADKDFFMEFEYWPRNLTKRDLEIDSPYNTYKYKGLPPGPICNPSLASIEAVASYQETPYWFYLADLQGVTHYAKTIEKHNANIARYLGK